MADKPKEFRSRRIVPADVLRHYVMCQMIASGISQVKVAAHFGVSRQAVLYQMRTYGQFPFHRVLDRLQRFREKYLNKDPALAQTILHAAECIVNLELNLKKSLESVSPLDPESVNLSDFQDPLRNSDKADEGSFVQVVAKEYKDTLPKKPGRPLPQPVEDF